MQIYLLSGALILDNLLRASAFLHVTVLFCAVLCFIPICFPDWAFGMRPVNATFKISEILRPMY